MTAIATTDLKLHDSVSGQGDVLVREGYAIPAGVDLDHPDLAELLQHGSIADGEPVGDGVGELRQLFARATLEKYEGGDADARAADPGVAPDEVIEGLPNLLTIGGASALFEFMLGNGTTTAAQALTYFNNANAVLAVGDSTTAAADTQTDLQAATNKLRKAMDATYPQHTDSTSSSAAKSVTLRATFATTDANFAWQEWGLFNASSAGRMFNRKVESLGTKTSAASWVLTITLSLA